ncbi:uncharacterized protein LOC120696167 [Panicum virgatum]|uniref:uncharacterized protein LOC120696167 n=1 Tax=Panicum virgatum TaxID=38727 RepID=UPI0019D5A23F|nr:uncharacterized protein LOC120696167 [Panicum virgatum]
MCWQYVTSTGGSCLSQLGFLVRHMIGLSYKRLHRYSDNFPRPPPGKFYLVDSGYPNRSGYLAPYKGVRYHQDDWKQAPRARGKKEIFNQAHSSIRSVIERSFGVLKMKWSILLGLPHYSERKQTQIILACCGLHNFIIENDSHDVDFNRDEPEVALPEPDENDDEP